MANFGTKFVQSGYDARGAADKEMLLHSAFYNVGIAAQGAFSSVANGGVIATHGLGYYPMHAVFMVTSSRSYLLPTALENATFPRACRVSTTQLINNSGQTLSGYYYIFKERLDEDRAAINVQTVATTRGSENADIGMVIAKDGYDVRTATLKDLVMLSGRANAGKVAQLHLMHLKKTGALSGVFGTPNTVTHNLGYRPQVWWFVKLTSENWKMVNNADDSFIDITTTDTKLYLPYAGDWCCVIFKDPTELT